METMDTLPEEILELVFSHLQKADLLTARLVSKRWRRISYTHSIQKRLITIIRNYREMVAFYSSSRAFFEHFKPVNMNLIININDVQSSCDIENGRKFWENHGGRLLNLTVFVDATHTQVLLDILENCPNLMELSLATNNTVNCKKGPFSVSFRNVNLKKLLTLNVLGYHYIVFPLIIRAVENSPRLENMRFSCCGGLCFKGRFHAPLQTNLNFTELFKLKSVYIQCANIEDIFMDKLTKSLGNVLESILIDNSESLSNLSLRYLGERCTRIKELVIGHWSNSTFNSGELFQKLTKLTVVSIYCTNTINDEMLAPLGVLSSLDCLCVTHCLNITDEGICKIFDNKVKRTITELRLVQLQITDRVMREVAPLLPNLKILNLSYCSLVTPASLIAVANNNPLLQCLTISGCNESDLVTLGLFLDEIPPCINRMTNLIHFTTIDRGILSIELSRRIILPHLKVFDNTIFHHNYADTLIRNPSLEFVNYFNIQTATHIDDYTVLLLRRKKILECYKSPFGFYNIMCLTKHG